MIRWTIVVHPDASSPDAQWVMVGGTIAGMTLPNERLELTGEDASVHAGEHAVFIRTNHQPMGGWADERVIPWHRIIDYRQETVE